MVTVDRPDKFDYNLSSAVAGDNLANVCNSNHLSASNILSIS